MLKMTKYPIIGLLCTAFLGACPGYLAASSAEGEGTRRIVAGVLRAEEARGWYVLDDKGHRPVNIERILVHNNVIEVHFPFEADVIHTFIAATDETFSTRGFLVGASVTRDRARIVLSKILDGNVIPVDAGSVRSRSANIWLYGVFSVESESPDKL